MRCLQPKIRLFSFVASSLCAKNVRNFHKVTDGVELCSAILVSRCTNTQPDDKSRSMVLGEFLKCSFSRFFSYKFVFW